MKELITVTEYQLLFLARQELTRRIDELETAIRKKETVQSLRRSEALLKMYRNQQSEISCRIAELNNEEW